MIQKIGSQVSSLYTDFIKEQEQRKEEYKQISDANEQGKTNNVRILDQTQSILKYNKNKKE
jgi:hypothetical protein